MHQNTAAQQRLVEKTSEKPRSYSLIQLEPVGAHQPGHIVDVGRDAVLKLQRCRRTTEPIDLGPKKRKYFRAGRWQKRTP